MRLLNALTFEFHDFVGQDVPPYAILSHTWAQETTYQEFLAGDWRRSDGQLHRPLPQGIQKVISFCAIAPLHECEWVWVDTCCMNKESSAELSESINSMYNWYKRATICCVHLSDFRLPSDANVACPFPTEDQLRHCRWFTRGFTLQELLAPESVIFYDETWRFIAYEDDIRPAICAITGIPITTLRSPSALYQWHRKPMSAHSVAERMRWAAKRSTTRVEDTAYCLLGIFGINMSLRYGEGADAFIRLQRKIIKTNDDESIFAWSWTPPPLPASQSIQLLTVTSPSQPALSTDSLELLTKTSSGGSLSFDPAALVDDVPDDVPANKSLPRKTRQSQDSELLSGILAPNPGAFFSVPELKKHHESNVQPFTLTNRGIEFQVFSRIHPSHDAFYRNLLFPLNCRTADDHSVAIVLTLHFGRWYRNVTYELVGLDHRTLDVCLFPSDYKDWNRFYIVDKSSRSALDHGLSFSKAAADFTASHDPCGTFRIRHDLQWNLPGRRRSRSLMVRFRWQTVYEMGISRTLSIAQLDEILTKKMWHPLALEMIVKVARESLRLYGHRAFPRGAELYIDPLRTAQKAMASHELAVHRDTSLRCTQLGIDLYIRCLRYVEA